ncbi:D-isomer specific 2-hydroxyacid dehydrogenase [Kickxella alabastrina]|uniref:D-isomer specific 2-hydroxyacid dehydrogenase n=1 Tax=Kickxella alabastrina TaxID=61397 RepID=UPI002221025A|nr:D-isomer specific 2-hydroxyacid dehydrogenase [Kickxella alabastrina]KAI7825427.1 D-isomer specific 2-hydroxyacid dehydrogenase [Kickxella alabastrina]
MSAPAKPIILVTRKLPAQAQARLSALTSVTVRQHLSTAPISHSELLSDIRGSSALICLLSTRSTASCSRQPGPSCVQYATADTTVLLALMASRLAKTALAKAAKGESAFTLSEGLGSQFTGKTLGIVGLGRIGCATGRRLLPFGFTRVLYTGSRPHSDRASALNAEFVGFHELLQLADLVCVCCPLTDRTRGMFGREAFQHVKPGSILVNTARGAVIDQEALLEALDAGALAHAALDVTVPEPLPAGHPLLCHPKCTVLPHIGSATEETRNAMANLAIDNALAAVLGQPMPAEVCIGIEQT